MPYINKVLRGDLTVRKPESAGELNYALTRVIVQYLGDKYNYQMINDAIGALEGCKLELYRRLAAPYEDEKIKANGDVY